MATEQRSTRALPAGFEPVSFAPDSHALITLGRTGADSSFSVEVWDWVAGTARSTVSLGPLETAAARIVSPDGRLFALGTTNGSLVLWDLASGTQRGQLATPLADPAVFVFSPDSRTLAAALPATERGQPLGWWNLATLQERRVAAPAAPSGWVQELAYSPDGRILAGACLDALVHLWDAQTGAELAALSGHREPVQRVAFCPGNKTLASASAGGVIKLWNAPTRREVATLDHGPGRVACLAFTSDGRTLVAADVAGAVRFWHTPSLADIDARGGK